MPVDQKRGSVKTVAPSGRAFCLRCAKWMLLLGKTCENGEYQSIESPYDIYDIFGLEDLPKILLKK